MAEDVVVSLDLITVVGLCFDKGATCNGDSSSSGDCVESWYCVERQRSHVGRRGVGQCALRQWIKN